MTNFVSETPEQIEQLIKKGHSIHLLDRIQSVLSSETISSETRLVFQLLKCKALIYLSHNDQALKILEEIKNEIFKIGKEVQQVDYYISKAEIFEAVDKAKEGLDTLKDAEKILQKSSTKDSDIMFQRKIDLLNLRAKIVIAKKRYFDISPRSSNEIIDSFNECINLSKERNYKYGLANSLEFKGWFLYLEGSIEQAIESFNEAFEIWKSEENKIGIATVLARKV